MALKGRVHGGPGQEFAHYRRGLGITISIRVGVMIRSFRVVRIE